MFKIPTNFSNNLIYARVKLAPDYANTFHV